MNILFVNYGDFTSNSLNHIGAFANRLTLLGHACVVAVPDNPGTITAVHQPLFTPVTFERALNREPIFPDRRGADVIHAWTPRENVREFTLAYLREHPSAALIVHLEDNEAFLIESYAHEPLEKLRTLSDEELAARLSPRLSHPVRFKNFLRLAHAATYITDRLREFIPDNKPAHRLLPGIDAALYQPQTPDLSLREKIGVRPDEKLLVFTGSTTFANLADIRALLLAVRQINDRCAPCKLVRTGINPPELAAELAAIAGDHVIDLGFVEKSKLAPLLALADVLVQPGTADDFNDYRLPSKIPEFLSVGRPVVIPRANLAREMSDGTHALLLDTGAPDDIADKCLRIFADPALAARLSAGAVEFARSHFDLEANTAELLAFYQQVKSTAAPLITSSDPLASEDVLLLDGDAALRMRAKEETIRHTRQVVATRDAEIAALHAELEKRNDIIAAKDRHIAELQRTIADLQRTIADLNRAIAELQQSIVDQRQAASAQQRDIVELQRTIGELNASLAQQRDALLAEFHQEKLGLAAQANYQHAKLQDARNQIEVLRLAVADSASALGHLTRELDAAKVRVDQAAAETRQRDQKIERITRSFSWQATSPLRSLRRTFIDPLAEKRARAAAARPRSIDPSIACTLDEPADWNNVPATGTLRGWAISRNNAAITAIRLHIGSRIVDATCGLARPDVAAGHPNHPHALQSGFTLSYTLPSESVQPLELEARTDDGKWRCIATPIARVAAAIPEHLRRDYTAWIQNFDTLDATQIVTLRARIDGLPPDQRPLISVLMPTYNTPERWLVKAIESVRAQLYPHWELCIADDASTAPHVRTVLADFAKRDARIKIVHREQNGHISAASNSALELATGEFTALLDHDDELAPHALAEIVFALAAHPSLDFIYSDEDKIDEQGRRFDPYFKPDWNPDLFLGQNYTCHLSAFRTARLRKIGGFRAGYEGSQDWDITLRFVEQLDPARIHHIPRVLYHWRAIAGSTALVVDQKSNYPFIAAKKALTDHLSRTGITAELVAVAGFHWRIKRALPATAPKVSIIIPTKNGEALLRLAIGSILAKTSYPNFEVIVVDNRSDDPSALAYFDELRRTGVRVLRYDEPFNFSAINNFAVRAAEGSVLAFLNNDIEVLSPDWLDEMVSHAVRPEIGCVGAMLYYPNDTIQHAGAVLGLTGPAGKDGVAGHAFKCFPRGAEGQRNRLRLVQNYSAVTAACLVIRREIFDAVDGYNESDLAVAFNDIDFCLRVLKAGYRNLWTPFAEFYHHESASRGLEDTPEKIARFQREIAYMRRTWAPVLDNDPAYNPNLSLQHEDFSLSFPPRVQRG